MKPRAVHFPLLPFSCLVCTGEQARVGCLFSASLVFVSLNLRCFGFTLMLSSARKNLHEMLKFEIFANLSMKLES
jgi:hypothetical protein